MKKASQADREYFARIARANRMLDDDRVPQSLDEMFDRLERIRREPGWHMDRERRRVHGLDASLNCLPQFSHQGL